MSTTSPTRDLNALLASLTIDAERVRATAAVRTQALEDAIADAEAWTHRRAARSAVDRARYRLGAAFEPTGRLGEIDDVILSGLDLLGVVGLRLLASLAKPDGGDTLGDLIVRLQNGRAAPAVRANGVWARRVWLYGEYRAVVDDFEGSAKGRDQHAVWRRNRPTIRQQFLILELARLHAVVSPDFADRGAAHDWLKSMRGRFDILRPPPLPPLPRLDDAS